MRLWAACVLVVVGCEPAIPDVDADGIPNVADCDKDDANVYPGAKEVCNGVDDDCDGTVDVNPTDGSTFFMDIDEDGYGTDAVHGTYCEAPEFYSAEGGDCDDDDPSVHPGAEEACNDLNDRNCDGLVSFEDADSDGIAACDDCNDADANQGGDEICDGIDNDCDDEVDEGATGTLVWYADADGDGLGDAETSEVSCAKPAGYVGNDLDCNDSNANALTELPAWYVDNDGDGLGDPDSESTGCFPPKSAVDNGDDCDDNDNKVGVVSTWYSDADKDGYGDVASATLACEAPKKHVADAQDCDDGDDDVNPDGIEVCNQRDDDCNGVADDDATDETTLYADTDGDGHGDPDMSTSSCFQLAGYVSNALDCDDEDATPTATWFVDADKDGLGDPDSESTECGAPKTAVDNGDDCDDSTGDVGAAPTWWYDGDEDSYGDPADMETACEAPDDYVDNAEDCDDELISVNPDGIESCNGLDDDCDGFADINATDEATLYLDNDGDGYGDVDSSLTSCFQVGGFVDNSLDCDDSDEGADRHPGADEYCNDTDDDCNEVLDDHAVDAAIWYEDIDGDGYGDPETEALTCNDGSLVDVAGDCDDTEDADDVSPLVTEACDGIDNNCDGDIDEAGADGEKSWYPDADEDLHGDETVDATVQCDPPEIGWVEDHTDCDDGEPARYQGKAEICDGIDNDCQNGIDDTLGNLTTWYLDDDGDGFGNPSTADSTCEEARPEPWTDTGGDCDDNDANDGTSVAEAADVHPDATEICDGIDNDCDELIDDLDSVEDNDSEVSDPVDLDGSGTDFYPDIDGDNFGDKTAEPVRACASADMVEDHTDCDDSESTGNYTYPGAPEVCDDQDHNCNGNDYDEGAFGETDWWPDADNDGYGVNMDGDDEAVPVKACLDPGDYFADNIIDCDDNNPLISATLTAFYHDKDWDGYGDPNDPATACVVEAITPEIDDDYVANDDDCDDDPETGADIGMITEWYVDSDGDGYGVGTPIIACESPGRVKENGDCNDDLSDGGFDINPHPDNFDICDGIDRNCDCSYDVGVPSVCGTIQGALDAASDLIVDYDLTDNDCEDPDRDGWDVRNALINVAAGDYDVSLTFPKVSSRHNTRVTLLGDGSATTVLRPAVEGQRIMYLKDYSDSGNYQDMTNWWSGPTILGTIIKGFTFADADLCDGVEDPFYDCGGAGDADNGGAVFIENGSPRFDSVAFCNNTANDGGAVFMRGSGLGDHSWRGTARFRNVTFQDNEAGYDGGGIYAESSNLEVYRSLFQDNVAEFRGAGLHTGENGFADHVIESVFDGNEACFEGGGIAASRHMRLTNVSFFGNKAGERGYGMSYISFSNAFTPMNIYAEFSGNSVLSANRCGEGQDWYNPGRAQLLLQNGFTVDIEYRGNLISSQIEHQAGDITFDSTPITSPDLSGAPVCGN
jgi:predicted outer membrane repeat protein